MRLVKRFFDLLLSIILLCLLMPVFIIVAIVLYFTDDEILFIQKRVGFKNTFFDVYKFSTMVEVEGGEPVPTSIGRILRKTKINELPQLLNVIKGEMSLVGPRPLPYKKDFLLYEKDVKESVYNVLPGITSLGSIVFRDEENLLSKIPEERFLDFKKDIVFKYKGALELWYQSNWSLWLDFKILIFTFWTVLFSNSQLVYRAFKLLPQRPPELVKEFDQLTKFKESLTIALIGSAFIIPFIPLPVWFMNNLQYLFAGLGLCFGFSYIYYRRKYYPIHLDLVGVFLLVYLVFSALSLTWATNSSFVLTHLFIQLLMILWYLFFKRIYEHRFAKLLMPYMFSMFFLIVLVYNLYAMFLDTSYDSQWNQILGQNANYTHALLIVLFPFFLYQSRNKFLLLFLKVLVLVITAIFLIKLKAFGCILGFVTLAIVYFVSELDRLKLRRPTFWSSIVILFSFFLLFIILLPYKEVTIEFESRFALIQSSIELWKINPLIGCGLGNWSLDISQFGLIIPFGGNDLSEFARYHAHNHFFKLLAEQGLVGLALYYVPILCVLFLSLKNFANISDFEKSSFLSFAIYLFLSQFYVVTYSHEYFFSFIQLVSFCSLGILSSVLLNKFIGRTIQVNTLVLLFLSFLTSCWFVAQKVKFDFYKKGEMHYVKGEYAEAINFWEKLYIPFISTHHNFKTPILHKIGKAYEELDQIDFAVHSYEKATLNDPYLQSLLYDYCLMLYKNNLNKGKALMLVDRLMKVDPQNLKTRELKILVSKM